jgi:hypothetical protein
MTPEQAAKAAKISRQALMKQITIGAFTAGGVDFVGYRVGKRWDVDLASAAGADRTAQANGAMGGRPLGPQGPAGGGPPIQALKAKKLYTDIKLGEQKLADHDRGLARDWSDCLRRALLAAGGEFAGKARAMRLPPEIADKVTALAQGLLDSVRDRLKEELETWEKERAK